MEDDLKARQSKIGRSNVRRSKAHERHIAHLLTDWSGKDFRRRRVEGRDSNVIDRESTADVIPVRDEVHFSIETKCGVLTSLDALLANPTGNIFSIHWFQTCYDAQLVSKAFSRIIYPLMFFRFQSSFDWMAISSWAFSNKILKPKSPSPETANNLVWFPHLYFDAYLYVGEISCNIVRTKKKDNMKFVSLKLDPVVLCRWKDFAKYVDPASFFYVKKE